MLKLAWRNLWRNRTRTAITGSAIALTLALQLMNNGIADSMYVKMIDSTTRAAGGSVLVHDKGYWEGRTTDLVLEDPDALRKTLSGVTGVKTVIPRVTLTGLVSSPRGNAGIQLLGIDPALEKQIKDWSEWVAKGGVWVDASDEKAPIVLGKKLVEDLKLEVGDRVVMTGTDPKGEITRGAFQLVGILDTGSKALDSSAAYTTIPAAQAAGNMGTAVTALALLLDDDNARHAVRDAAVTAVGEPAMGLEFLTWDEAMPELVSFIALDRAMNDKFGFFLFLIVAFGIANTLMMAVLERVREFGLLGALGVTPGRLAQLVMAESLMLAGVFITVGMSLGYGLHRLIAANGIDYGKMTGQSDMQLSGVLLEDLMLYSELVPIRWITAAVAVLILVVLSSLYPAWKATRMEPATAMRTYE